MSVNITQRIIGVPSSSSFQTSSLDWITLYVGVRAFPSGIEHISFAKGPELWSPFPTCFMSQLIFCPVGFSCCTTNPTPEWTLQGTQLVAQIERLAMNEKAVLQESLATSMEQVAKEAPTSYWGIPRMQFERHDVRSFQVYYYLLLWLFLFHPFLLLGCSPVFFLDAVDVH